MARVVHLAIPALAVVVLLTIVGLGATTSSDPPASAQGVSTNTATSTATATSTVTPTPTSFPGPPMLLQPADGATLPQPVAPNQWLFSWSARTGPCYSTITINGPGGRQVGSSHVDYPLEPFATYQFRYQATEVLPNDALGPWTWSATVVCPGGSNTSETRTFQVQAASTPTATPTLGERVGLCHATGSTRNPYVFITVNRDALAEHLAHGDFRASSAAGCSP